MPSRTTKPRWRFKLLAGLIALLAIIFMGIAVKMMREAPVVRSHSSRVIKLEGYAFNPGRIRYELRRRPLAKILAKVLPQAATKKIKWLEPDLTTSILSGSFNNEPFLSVAFSERDAGGFLQIPGSRVIVL